MSLCNKIGFSTNIFDNPADIASLVESLANDFNAIEIEFEKDLRLLIDSDEVEWHKQRDKLNLIREVTGVYYSTHAPYIGMETDISSRDEVTRLCAVDYLSRYIVRAAEIGAEIITIHPGYVEVDQFGMASFDFDQLAKSLEALSVVSAKHKIEILLENTGPDREKYIVLSDEQHERLCQYGNISLTLDLVHFHAFYHKLNKTEYLEKLKKIIPDVKNAHFNDVCNGEHVHLPLQKGNFDYHQVLDFMRGEGYQGNFIVEESGGGYSPHDFVVSARNYIGQLKAGRVQCAT
ncbi:sugar phosphate isomerase/epimerase family protein [Pseudomonas chlororaphis]|uniref:sugar phosphate isomerase/epimerase family protein n=1 Tax=Pseudomonas chlororaphis TaxID=587753 RepID=UPI0015DF438A|nr:sugar phosphate isomerase/epimerase family protein [Pseudomonas chlororaphis]QLL11838.1 sugar phosphate isomerase/epimerase [Pseudomonas chlororaphis subsp. aurantiaca]